MGAVSTCKCVLGLSGMHQKNSITFDSYNSFDMELGIAGDSSLWLAKINIVIVTSNANFRNCQLWGEAYRGSLFP